MLIIAAAGCTRDRVYESIYEGLRDREQVVNPLEEPISPEQPGYDAYKRERDKTLERNNDDKLNPQ